MEALGVVTDSFIVTVRTTPAEAPGGAVEWRGIVEHVQSRDRTHFIDLARLNEFIVSHSGVAPSPLGFRRRLWQRIKQWTWNAVLKCFLL